MSRDTRDSSPAASSSPRQGRPGEYPVNHVVGVIDTAEQARRSAEALTSGGFLTSEVHVVAGQAAAEMLDTTTGRRGVADLLIRVAARFGLVGDEMQRREQYEQALRDGCYVLAVETPTDARKDLAARILGEHGAHTVTFMGRFTIEGIIPPNPQ